MKERIRSFLSAPVTGRRTVMTAAGVLFSGVAAGILKASRLGAVIPIPFGTLYVLIDIVLLIGMFAVDRHYIGLGTIINLFLLGYVVEGAQRLTETLFPDPGLIGRGAMLIVALPFLCLASSLYFTADLGVSTYDVWALVLDRRTRLPFRALRIGTDLACVALGFALLGFSAAGVIGVGTVVTALFMGPLIDLFNRKVFRPLLEREKVK